MIPAAVVDWPGSKMMLPFAVGVQLIAEMPGGGGYGSKK